MQYPKGADLPALENRFLRAVRHTSKVKSCTLQLKEVWVDAWCPRLTDTWESSAYQRAIAVDALWLTFMRMLEPASRIKIRKIICTDAMGETRSRPEIPAS